mmetsp:Transcript_8893/g.8799  ORF Transcript_8893/g.8799 Transcript_8893/m.8799 type:complete len:534 (+) Transcript_8893:324-1925(+)|eukprot:CAMPEP_0119035514 /NCGR_PEP_ID=MMETSP1177-20130426/2574_1 /TAXON_ID=2985 /ORGANISM="Ochromonas sp, Strain CCMP1899" /LENGTH=533 /DNA_ID=CAMNT_0006993885 /DNA_START=324 /DNA_END=1925 /DNA_ORIENTATION=-
MINIEDRANGDRDHDEGDLLKPLNEVKNNVLPLVPGLLFPEPSEGEESTNLTSRVDTCSLTELANIVEKNTEHVRISTDLEDQSKLFIAAIENNLLNGEKRKRASSMDILIESSLFLSMTNPNIGHNYSSNGNENNDMKNNDISGIKNNINIDNKHISSIESSENDTESDSTDMDLNSIKNTFWANSPAKSTDSKITDSAGSDNDTSSFECIDMIAVAAASHSALQKYRKKIKSPLPLYPTDLSYPRERSGFQGLEVQDPARGSESPLPRTRRTNRPRASTFSVSNSQFSDVEADRTPLGMVTWLASLEDDAKLLTELGCNDEANDPLKKFSSFSFSHGKDDSAFSPGSEKRSFLEPPAQRRRRANSVIEVTSKLKDDSYPIDMTPGGINSGGRNPRTYKKDPNWALEGRPRGYVGAYSPAERRRRIERFLEKRRLRVWQKNVKYDVRKNFADSRIRVKGRFVKKEEQASLIAMGLLNNGNGKDNMKEITDYILKNREIQGDRSMSSNNVDDSYDRGNEAREMLEEEDNDGEE